MKFEIKTVCAREYVDKANSIQKYDFNGGYALKFNHIVIVTFSVDAPYNNAGWEGVRAKISLPWRAKYYACAGVDGQKHVPLTAAIQQGSSTVQILSYGPEEDCWARGQLIYFTDD